MDEPPKRSPERERPAFVFLISPTARSGTNYVRYLLIESGICERPKSPILQAEDWYLPNSDLLQKFIANVRNSQPKAAHAPGGTESDLLAAQLFREFGEALKRSVHARGGKPVLLKTPSARNVANFFALYGTEKLLIVVRDGRDTCESFYRSEFVERREDAFRLWADMAQELAAFLNEIRGTDLERHVHLVHYEDCVARPAGEVQKMAAWLGRPVEDVDTDSLNDLPVYGSSQLNRTADGRFQWAIAPAPEGFNPVGRWRDWPDSVRRSFKAIANGPLVAFGYETDDTW